MFVVSFSFLFSFLFFFWQYTNIVLLEVTSVFIFSTDQSATSLPNLEVLKLCCCLIGQYL